MTSRIEYYIADEKDDAQLRQLLHDIPVEGAMKVAFLREPNYFKAVQVEGTFTQTIVVTDLNRNNLIGMGTRSVKPAFINGKLSTIGYLSSLRGKKQYRGGSLLMRGYKLFKKFHADGRTQLYLSTIIEDNEYAKAVLASKRASMPDYQDMGQFHTFAISTRQKSKTCKHGYEIRTANDNDVDNIIRFLKEHGAQKQFFPSYTRDDIISENGLLNNLHCKDILLAFNDKKLVGITSAWDQSSFKQSVIMGYEGKLKLMRPFVNLYSLLNGYPLLGKPGSNFDYVTIGMVCIKNNDKSIFQALLNAVFDQLKNETPVLLAGFHESDHLLDVVKQYKHILYSSRLYVVFYEDGKEAFETLDSRPVYLELGAM